MRTKYFRSMLFIGCLSLAAPFGAQASSESLIYSFGGAGDANPIGQLALSATGTLYGTTRSGGTNGWGDVFQMSFSSGRGTWTEQPLLQFSSAAASGGMGNVGAFAGVTLEIDGSLVGTAGLNGGDLFMYSPASGSTKATETLVKPLTQFSSCYYPSAMARDTAGNLYGYAVDCRSSGQESEVVFKMTRPTGTQKTWTTTVLYTFPNTNGPAAPMGSPLVASNGIIYGISRTGGPSGDGEVFTLTPPSGSVTGWTFKALYDWTYAAGPVGGLTADAAGNLYFELGESAGEIAMLTKPKVASGPWYLSALWHFGSGSDGTTPTGTLALTPNNMLAGTTRLGGTAGEGIVFELPVSGASGAYKVLYNFGTTANDGTYPDGNLVVDTAGHLYGSALMGGANDKGAIFMITP